MEAYLEQRTKPMMKNLEIKFKMIFLGKLFFAFASTPRADFRVMLELLIKLPKNFKKYQIIPF